VWLHCEKIQKWKKLLLILLAHRKGFGKEKEAATYEKACFWSDPNTSQPILSDKVTYFHYFSKSLLELGRFLLFQLFPNLFGLVFVSSTPFPVSSLVLSHVFLFLKAITPSNIPTHAHSTLLHHSLFHHGQGILSMPLLPLFSHSPFFR